MTAQGVLTLTVTGPRYSANDRPPNWAVERKLKKRWREAAQSEAARLVGPDWVPPERVRVIVTQVPHRRGRVDPGNTAPAAKAAIDGMVLAGLLVDDDSEHLIGPDYRLADVPVRQARGQWTLRITATPLDAGVAP